MRGAGLLLLLGVGCSLEAAPCAAPPDLWVLGEAGFRRSGQGPPEVLLTEGSTVAVVVHGRSPPERVALVRGEQNWVLPSPRRVPVPGGVRLEWPGVHLGPQGPVKLRFDDATCLPARVIGADGSGADPALQAVLTLQARARAEAAEGDFEASAASRQSMAEAAEAAGYISLAVVGHMSSAFFHWRGWRWERARLAAGRARALASQDPAPRGAIGAAVIQSYLQADEGMLRSAMEQARWAETEARRFGERGLALDAARHRARLLSSLGQPEAAVDALAALGREAGQAGLPVQLATANDEAYARLRLLRSRRDLRPEAWAPVRALSERAVELGTRRGWTERVRIGLTNLALAAEATGEQDELRSLILRMEGAGAFEPGGSQVEAEAVRARLLLRDGELEGAEAGFRRALEAALEATQGLASDDTWPVRVGLGRALLAQERVDDALDSFEAAIEDVEVLSFEAHVHGLRARFLDDRRFVFEDCASALLSAGRSSKGLEVLERGRAQLDRHLEIAARRARLSPEARAALEPAAVAYFRAKRELAARGPLRLEVAKSELAGFEAGTARLRAEVEARFAALGAQLERVAPAAPTQLDLDRLQAQLRSGERVVGFHELGPRLHAFVLSPQGLTVRVLPESALEVLAWLLELEGEGPLGIVPGGAMTRERLHAALAPELWAKRPFYYLTRFGGRMKPELGFADPPLVVADPSGDLPHARQEGRRVAALWPGARLLVGDEVTKAAFREALAKASMLHFAGHGRHGEGPWSSELQLGGGERTSLRELLVEGATVATVVLSGCETGRYRRFAGDYGVGLAEAFLLAGTHRVVATTVPVPDEAAASFMIRFHRAARQHGLLEGLRRAVLESPLDEREVALAYFVVQ